MSRSCETCIYARWNVEEEYVSGCEKEDYMTGELVDQCAEQGVCDLYAEPEAVEVDFSELEEELPF